MSDEPVNSPDPALSASTFSPREFLRQRKPEAFSDSEIIEAPAMTRPFLEYFFDTLTSRSQELAFESFARKLSQRVICPNLQPHTGPTGGGDSKVDTESFAVADDLALTWFYGHGAHDERWAFAFSAKEDWRGKVQSDIGKVAGTGRPYARAIFISSRFIKDRERSEVEDALTKKYGLPVEIHDRNWVLDQLFQRDAPHFDLLVGEFGLAEAVAPVLRKGLLDREREDELVAIEGRLADAAQTGVFSSDVVDASLESVRIARSLERPRPEIDGLLARAARIAAKGGTAHQRMMVSYETAWTAFWFYEDASPVEAMYPIVEAYALESRYVFDLELVSNLWLLLRTSAARGGGGDFVSLASRGETLRRVLDELANDVTRPSAALYATTILLELELVSADVQDVPSIFKRLREVLRNSEGHLGYPLLRVIRNLRQIGENFEDVEGYDELYSVMAELSGKREGETSEALMLLERGQRHIAQKRPYDALRMFGRVLNHLYTEETRDEVSIALYLCGFAFEEIGLLWAARAATLHAANIASSDFYARQEITWLQCAGYNRMKWLELRLGRLPALMAWHELDVALRANLTHEGRSLPAAHSEHLFDLLVSVVLLKLREEGLSRVTALPAGLDALGLHMSAATVRFLLGHDPELPAWLVGEDPRAFFERLARQPAAGQLPCLSLDSFAGIEGGVLGTKIRANTDSNRSSVHIAESLVSMIESFLSTTTHRDVMGDGPEISMSVRHKADLPSLLSFDVGERFGIPHVEIVTRVPDDDIAADVQLEVKEQLSKCAMELIARSFHFRNLEQTFIALLRDEKALARATDFGVTLVVEANILGPTAKHAVEDWARDPVMEVRPDHPTIRSSPENSRPRRGEPTPPEAPPRHDEIQNVSLIRSPLWQRAKWFGTAFFMSPDLSVPPTLALLFRDASAAEEIFAAWQRELGDVDEKERLRVAIVRGVSRREPLSYTVIIGTELDTPQDDTTLITFSRACLMDAQSDTHLLSFLARYTRLGSYLLVPAVLNGSAAARVGPVALRKTTLHVRWAWEVGLDDPDMAAIDADTDVVLPTDDAEPPVIALQAWMRRESTEDD